METERCQQTDRARNGDGQRLKMRDHSGRVGVVAVAPAHEVDPVLEAPQVDEAETDAAEQSAGSDSGRRLS